MNAPSLPEPYKVSPLIKFSRWTLLLSGIFYGVNKLAFYRAYDKPLAVRRHKQEEEDLAKKKIENKKILIDVLVLLGGIVGLKFEPGWEPDFLK